MLRTGTYAFLQVALLETTYEGCAHHGRQVAILTIRLFQTVEAGRTAHIDHRREGQYATHLTHQGARLECLQLGQLRIERACLTYLLGIDGGAKGVNTREHLFVQEGRDAVGRVVDEPVLDGGSTVAEFVGIARLLHGEL